MLVNCPKCNFSQPKDRYCASCGIDMELFKPATVPLSKRLLNNPYLHVTVVCALLLGCIFFVRQKQKEELRARVEYLKGGPVLVERNQPVEMETTSSASEAEQPPPAEVTQPTPASVPAQPSNANSATTVGSTNGAGPQPAAQAPTNPATSRTVEGAAGPKIPTRAVVIYAEVEQRVLNAWMEEMRASGQGRTFDDVTMGPLTQVSQKLKTPGVKVLQRIDQSLQTARSTHEWFVGTHRGSDPDQEMGFFSSLVMGDMKDGLIRGEIEVQRAFRDQKDPMKAMERVSFGGPFEFPVGNGFVMRGLLPSKYATDLDDDAHPDPVLSILKSPSFGNGQTEFTLILEFDTTSPQAR